MAERINGIHTPGTPFCYLIRASFLHRWPAGLKLLCVIILSTAAYLSLYALAFSVLLVLVSAICARLPLRFLLRGMRPLVTLALCIMLFSPIGAEMRMLAMVLRILLPFCASALLFSATTMRELCLSLSSLELRIKSLFSAEKSRAGFSLGMSLMLGFIPRFFELWEETMLASRARCCKKGLRRLFFALQQVPARMMESAADTALALEARGQGACL